MSKKEKEKRLPIKERFGVLVYFMKMAWKENKVAVFWVFFSTFPSMFFPFIAMVFPKLIIDELLEERRVIWLAAWILAMITSEILLRYLSCYANMRHVMGREWFDYYMERNLSVKVMKMKFALTENPKAMDQYQKALNGMDYSGGIGMLLAEVAEIVSAFVTMVGVIGIISIASPLLLVVSILVVVIEMILTSREIKVNLHYYNLVPKINRVFEYVFDNLSDFAYGKDLRLYKGMDMVREMGTDATEKVYSLASQRANKGQCFNLLSQLVEVLKNAFTYGYLGILAILGRITIGDFTMLMSAAETFTSDCMQRLIRCLQGLGNDLELIEAYRCFMEYPEETEEGDGLPESTLKAPVFEFRDVTFRYPDTEQDILRHVNLTIQPGEHICVVGENGAGKTTFIKLLCRLYPVTEGDILLNGTSIYSYGYGEYQKLLSVVFQDFKLFSFTIRDNLLLAAGKAEQGDRTAGNIPAADFAGQEGMENRPLTDERLQEICEMAGFGKRLAELPHGLDTGLYKNFYEDGVEPSGGEAQKLAIARALCKEAPVVVLDEPTAALDPLAEAEIYEHFQQMSMGKTAIFISHRLSSCQFCDRIVVFAEHGIAECGTHKELLEKRDGIYAAMFQTQAENYR